MKSRNLIAAIVIVSSSAFAQVPQYLNYQGRVSVSGVNFSGQGQFKFALVVPGAEVSQVATGYPVFENGEVVGFNLSHPGSGYDPNNPPSVSISAPSGEGFVATAVVAPDGYITSVTIDQRGSGYINGFYGATIGLPPGFTQVTQTTWSNDNSSNSGSEPGTAVTISVTNGLYAVKLGDMALGMSALNNGHVNTPVHLRVWFSDGVKSFQQLTPDQPLGTAPYAFLAERAEWATQATSANVASSVAPGAITSSMLAPGAVSVDRLNITGSPSAGNVLGYGNGGNLTWLTPSGGGGITFPFFKEQSSDQPLFTLENDSGKAISGTSYSDEAITGYSWAQSSGVYGECLVQSVPPGEHPGQGVYGFGRFEAIGVFGESIGNDGIKGQTSAAFRSGVFGYANRVDNNGVAAINPNGTGIFAKTERQAATAGFFWNSAGGNAILADGKITAYKDIISNGVGNEQAYIGGDGAGFDNIVDVEFGSKNASITRATFYNQGSGKLLNILARDATVRTLTITGGADLAEPFAMSEDEVSPGSVVIIDEENPGKLRKSHAPYDKKVAGIVSGADGINPGISMIQKDMLEAGENVALSGRVYVKANNSAGDIEPGDLLTTSAIPGEAMKASDHDRAQGAILGKAMTKLSDNSGKVLVLVTLQ